MGCSVKTTTKTDLAGGLQAYTLTHLISYIAIDGCPEPSATVFTSVCFSWQWMKHPGAVVNHPSLISDSDVLCNFEHTI